METQELSVLEEKIEKLVEYCVRLRNENNDLTGSLNEKIQEIESLQGKLSEYDDMRQNVKERINRLVQTIEGLEASAQGESTDTAEGEPIQPDLLPHEHHVE